MKVVVSFFERFAVLVIRFAYLFYRPLKIKKRITIISRQSDEPTEDVKMLVAELVNQMPEYEIAVLTKTLNKANFISYVFHMFTQMKYFATSRVIVLDGYCIICGIIKHKKKTTVVQMWHALAAVKKFGYDSIDKAAGRDADTARIMGMHKNYDYIVAPSETTALHFLRGFDESNEKIVIGGLPRADLLVSGDTIEIEEERKIVLYAPTFRRGGSVDIDELKAAIDNNKYKLIVKLHPLDRNYDRSEKKFGIYQWLRTCDYVITDYSALGVEAALAGKPVFWYVFDIDDYEESTGLNINPEEIMPQATARSVTELVELLENEYDYKALARFRDKFIEVTPGECTVKLAKFISEKAGERRNINDG